MPPVGTAEPRVEVFGAVAPDAIGYALADLTTMQAVETTLWRLVGRAEGRAWLELLVAWTIYEHATDELRREMWDALVTITAWDYSLAHPAGKGADRRASFAMARGKVQALMAGFVEMVAALPGYAEVRAVIDDLAVNNIFAHERQPDAMSEHRDWVKPGDFYLSFQNE